MTDKMEQEEKLTCIYSPKVLMGNWNEDMFMLEAKMKNYKILQAQDKLYEQKINRMIANTTKPVELSLDSDFIKYGDVIQIQTTPNSDRLALSGVVTEKLIEAGKDHFVHGCPLAVSPDVTPQTRNCFIFTSCEHDRSGQNVFLGQDFYLRIHSSHENIPLYLQCETPGINNFGGDNAHFPVRLSRSPDIYCRFKVLALDPEARVVTAGSPFHSNVNVLIQHSISGQNLAAEFEEWIKTMYGPEMKVTVHTYRDTHRMETKENFWKVVVRPNPDVTDKLICRCDNEMSKYRHL